jgi:hypothetical protein
MKLWRRAVRGFSKEFKNITLEDITIVTLVDWRPDFIKIQYESLKNHFQENFSYIVVNNSFNSNRRDEISRQCSELGIKEVKVKRNLYLALREFRPAFKLIQWGDSNIRMHGRPRYKMNEGYSKFRIFGKSLYFLQYRNVTVACSYGMNYIVKKIYPKVISLSRYFMILDSDMFFVGNFSIHSTMKNCDIVFTPQYRGKNGEVYYATNGFVIVDTKIVEEFKKHDWRYGLVNGYSTDVGGKSTKLVHDYKNKYRVKHFHTLSVVSSGMLNKDEFEFMFTLDGSWHANIRTDLKGKLLSILESDQNSSINIFFEQFNSVNDLKFLDLVQSHLYYLINFIGSYDWPLPLYIEFLPLSADNPVVFHYKSGSNYQSFATSDYNFKKTEILKSIIYNSP